ncbi:MAG: hypothetical protein FJ104_02195 [Deltaproteobacteria bacterium]|nr:hypothetical protein [Deltaproteobacteria bacterium]
MAARTLLWWLVPIAGLAELGGHFHVSRRAPGLADWQAARPAVEALRRPGEPLLVAPRWAEPVARHVLGDARFPLEEVARADESRFEAALEVSLLGESAPEIASWPVLEERRAGKLLLRRRKNPAPRPALQDLVGRVPDATVVDVVGGVERPCPWDAHARREAGGLHGDQAYPAARHACPGAGAWHFVGVTVIEDEQWRPRRCIWAHPAQGVLRIHFPDVPLGAALTGHAGLPQWYERERRGAPIQLRFSIDGAEVGSVTHKDGDGWAAFELPTPGRAGQRGALDVSISAPRAQQRQLCFEVATR